MRYQEHAQPLETGGMQETAVFSIAATGKAFRNLMDGLYSDKIEAFCREILTNAYDSHCEAGTPARLFEVWVPTIFDKRLRIRDYGVGMDHQQVMTRYSTLFDSTKDQSDDYVGMLGLGSKSPFAYTDGFSLRCWDGEECRVYSAYLGPGGVPQISLASRSPSDEPRGVEVGIPVKREDFDTIQEKLGRVCVAFAHPPVLPRDAQEAMRFEVALSGTGWATGRCPSLEKIFYARQGCVLYPIPDAAVKRTITTMSPMDYDRCTVVVDFDLGELDVATSREQLSLTERTNEAIDRRLKAFLEELSEEFAVHFEDCRTDYEIAQRWARLEIQGIPKFLVRMTPQATTGDKVAQALHGIMRRRRGCKDPWRWTRVSLRNLSGGKAADVNGTTYYYVNASESYHIERLSFPDTQDKDDIVWVVDTESSNAKIAWWLHSTGRTTAVVLRRPTCPAHERIRVPHPEDRRLNYREQGPQRLLIDKTNKQLTEDDLLRMPIVAQLGRPPFIRASGFAKPPVQRRETLEFKEDGLELDPESYNLKPVDRKRLLELRRTHEFYFYSKQRKAVLRPRGDLPAGDWDVTFHFGEENSELHSILRRMKVIRGKTPNIALVRVYPSTKYDEVRAYRPASTLEDLVLEHSDDKFWDDVVPLVLGDFLSDVRASLSEDIVLDAMEASSVPCIWRVARILRARHEMDRTGHIHKRGRMITDANEAYYLREKYYLMKGAIRANDAVMRRFVQEARARDFTVPVLRGPDRYEQECLLSSRWRMFLKRTANIAFHVENEEFPTVFRALESAELEIQARGGRICRGRRRKQRPQDHPERRRPR